MATIDVEVFAAILCEQCLNFRLCADIVADPTKLAVESTGAGWLLLFLEDGERKPIGLQRFEGVLMTAARCVQQGRRCAMSDPRAPSEP
jgi:hypothetical protein